VKEDVGCQSF